DYSRTSMRLWHWYVNTPLDPSLFHYVYYPATFLLPLPFAALSVALHLPFDVRLVWLGAIGVAGWALWAMPWRWEWRYVALCALFLDPLFYFPQGRNDILWLAGITLGLLAFSRGRLRLAALAFGAALAFKPFAVFFAILIAVAIVRRCGGWRPLRTAGILAGLAVPAALTIGPFFLWNPAAFWADTVAFVAGTDPHSYPMGGVGLAGLLLALHVIPSPTAQIPLSLLQAGLTLPALGLAGRQVWRRPSPAAVVVGGTVVLALFLLCARFVNDNYLASLVYLAVLAGAAGRGHVAANPAQTPAVTPQAA
ncbi:MAG TPA: hypothetical protein VET65_09365, partial [Candidatus Limnocylindrales bacterium]|nr:hypothetical protein [Candidatus Limnocylindrales bacterium]